MTTTERKDTIPAVVRRRLLSAANELVVAANYTGDDTASLARRIRCLADALLDEAEAELQGAANDCPESSEEEDREVRCLAERLRVTGVTIEPLSSAATRVCTASAEFSVPIRVPARVDPSTAAGAAEIKEEVVLRIAEGALWPAAAGLPAMRDWMVFVSTQVAVPLHSIDHNTASGAAWIKDEVVAELHDTISAGCFEEDCFDIRCEERRG